MTAYNLISFAFAGRTGKWGNSVGLGTSCGTVWGVDEWVQGDFEVTVEKNLWLVWKLAAVLLGLPTFQRHR